MPSVTVQLTQVLLLSKNTPTGANPDMDMARPPPLAATTSFEAKESTITVLLRWISPAN